MAMPLSIRLSVLYEPGLGDGNTIEYNIEFLKRAREAGVDIINVLRGNFSGMGNIYEIRHIGLTPRFNVYNANAARIKSKTGFVMMSVGRTNLLELAGPIFSSGKAGIAAMNRAQLTDLD